MSARLFSDVMWAYNQRLSMNIRPVYEMKHIVLNSPLVTEQIKTDADRKEAATIFKKMSSDIRPGMVKAFGYSLRKIWKSIYEKLVVDDKAIKKLKKLAGNKKRGPILYMPTHRSYIDFLVLSYILFSYGMEVPYIAAREDFLNIMVLNHVLRRSGAFFLKKSIS
jgi:glycerol-3-phosphate O-acyltransferase